MDNLKARFDLAKAPWSDVQGHLDTFVDLVVDNGYRKILELGVRHGTSTAAWLWAAEQTDGHVWSVDWDKLVNFDTDRWTFYQYDDRDPTLWDVLSLVGPFDVVFIDTSHQFAHTVYEIQKTYPLLSSGGTLVFHDTEVETFEHHESNEPAFPVRKAVYQFLDYLDDKQLPHSVARYEDFFGLMMVTLG